MKATYDFFLQVENQEELTQIKIDTEESTARQLQSLLLSSKGVESVGLSSQMIHREIELKKLVKVLKSSDMGKYFMKEHIITALWAHYITDEATEAEFLIGLCKLEADLVQALYKSGITKKTLCVLESVIRYIGEYKTESIAKQLFRK